VTRISQPRSTSEFDGALPKRFRHCISASSPRHREKRATHLPMRPLALDEPAKGAEFGLYMARYRITRGNLLLALLSAAVLALLSWGPVARLHVRMFAAIIRCTVVNWAHPASARVD
jgi:hypothetical protein